MTLVLNSPSFLSGHHFSWLQIFCIGSGNWLELCTNAFTDYTFIICFGALGLSKPLYAHGYYSEEVSFISDIDLAGGK